MNLHKLRRFLYPHIHAHKQRIGEEIDVQLYAKYAMEEDEFVVSLDMDLEEAYTIMGKMGFHYEPIAALKIWGPTGKIEDGSFVKRDSTFSPMQLHIHLFQEGDQIIFAGHWEYSWIRHPHKHYRGKIMDFESAEQKLKKLFDKHEIDY